MTAPPDDPLASAPAAESFLREHGDTLAQALGHDSWRAADELVRTLGDAGALPPGVTAPRLFQVVLSLRATTDLMAVEHRFGTPAHDVLLGALTRHFEATVAPPGRFHLWIAAAHETIRRAPDPRAWMAAHARAVLGTVDPDHATFHTALAYAWHVGPSIATVVERHLLPG